MMLWDHITEFYYRIVLRYYIMGLYYRIMLGNYPVKMNLGIPGEPPEPPVTSGNPAGTPLGPPGRPLGRPKDVPRTPRAPPKIPMGYKNGHIFGNLQRQKLSIAATESVHCRGSWAGTLWAPLGSYQPP